MPGGLMKRNVIIILYVLLLAGGVFFGLKFRAGFNQTVGASAGDASTNQVAVSTNQPPDSTNQAPVTAVTPAGSSQSKGVGQMMTHAVLGFVCLVGLGILAARDISHFLAHRVEKFIFNEDLEGERDPEYEEAEKVWANGKHLEAIQLMRDYLKTHPREQYVALRIAEIYEKDLNNFVAATLEYEEIIKRNLPAERWGWAAIHLANLYSGKMNKTEQATALLRRIIDEHPHTAAAKKARERLGEAEPVVETAAAAEVPAATEAPKPPQSNLPPGFRPKT